MPFVVRWQVKDNPAKEQLFILEKTVNDYKKHLTGFAGDKLLYFDVDEVE